MRHHKAGATVHKLVKGRLHLHLRTGVNRAGRFIKQQDLWVAEHDAGDAQQLPLALRQRASALAYHRVEPPGQCADETVRMRPDSRPLNLLARRARAAVGDVVVHGAFEQPGILQDHAKARTQVRTSVGGDVDAVELYASPLHIVEAKQ